MRTTKLLWVKGASFSGSALRRSKTLCNTVYSSCSEAKTAMTSKSLSPEGLNCGDVRAHVRALYEVALLAASAGGGRNLTLRCRCRLFASWVQCPVYRKHKSSNISIYKENKAHK